MKTIRNYVIATLLFVLVCVGFILLLNYSNNKVWNNGICTKCEIGNYCYKEAVAHRGGTSYIYECDNCNHIIKIAYTH